MQIKTKVALPRATAEENKLIVKPKSDSSVKLGKKNPPRYNWAALKLEFIQGPWDTAAEFRRFKGFKDSSANPYVASMMTGWGREKQEFIAKAAAKATSLLVDKKAEEIRLVRERQASLARKLQTVGEESLPNLKPETLDEARKAIQAGMQEERAAIGVDQKGGAKNLTQVNVNLPKTNFDKIIDGRDFEQLLKFVADIRRERVRRTGEIDISTSKAEIDG